MIQNELRKGVELTISADMLRGRRPGEVAAAIAAAALFSGEKELQLLAVDLDATALVRYDLLKAALATAGVLGATIPLVTDPLGVTSVLAALGALGALQGWNQPLPRTCAQLVICLFPRKTMSRAELNNQFLTVYEGSSDQAKVEFQSSLEQLEHLGCVRATSDVVTLVERVLVRR